MYADVDECFKFCLLTDHEVDYAAVDTQGDDPHRSKINEHLGQKEDGSTIVATHILMAGRENTEYYGDNFWYA